jgi:hypothetical protein
MKYTVRVDKEFCQVSPVAMEWIEQFVNQLKHLRKRKKAKILEFGAGVSTVTLAEMFPDDEIISIEENKKWYENVKKWLKERKLKNVNLIFEEVLIRNYYRFDETTNLNYFHIAEQYKPFDLIINDGNMREYIGANILENIDSWLTKGGLYLRHDYEKALAGVWIGHTPLPVMDWFNGSGLGYDMFCGTHPGYALLTVGGNGKWGYKAELGGIWRNEA